MLVRQPLNGPPLQHLAQFYFSLREKPAGISADFQQDGVSTCPAWSF